MGNVSRPRGNPDSGSDHRERKEEGRNRSLTGAWWESKRGESKESGDSTKKQNEKPTGPRKSVENGGPISGGDSNGKGSFYGSNEKKRKNALTREMGCVGGQNLKQGGGEKKKSALWER